VRSIGTIARPLHSSEPSNGRRHEASALHVPFSLIASILCRELVDHGDSLSRAIAVKLLSLAAFFPYLDTVSTSGPPDNWMVTFASNNQRTLFVRIVSPVPRP
jgi:hypothetical protein